MKLTIRLFSLLLLCAISLLLFSCGESDDATKPFERDPVPAQFDDSAVNIGSIVNSPSTRNAILLAQKQINSTGGVLGKQYNVVGLVAADTDEAVFLVRALLDFDVKIINVSYSSRSKAASEYTIPAEIPLVSESATSPFFTTYDDNDFYFRMVPSDVIQGRILAEIAIEQGHTTAVTVHNDTDQYGETLVDYFTLNFEQLGGAVLSQVAVPFGVTTGFDDYLQVIIDQSPDMVLDVILEADESANFWNEAIATGIQSKFLFPDASAGVGAFANNIADVSKADELLGTAPGFGLSTNPEMIYFAQSYEDQYQTSPEAFNVSGYDYAMVAALAIEHAGYVNNTDNPTGAMVRDSLRTVMNAPGTKIGPSNIGEGLEIIRNGGDVDYSGAYGANEWDANGDVAGEMTYDVLTIDVETKSWVTAFQQQVFVPLVD